MDHSVDTFWDDETLRDVAQCFGNPEPSVGECRGLRQQIKDKLDRAKVGTSVTTDGRKVSAQPTNSDSLTFALRQQHVERDTFYVSWWVDMEESRTLAERWLAQICETLEITAAEKRTVEYVEKDGTHVIKQYVRHATNCQCPKCKKV